MLVSFNNFSHDTTDTLLLEKNIGLFKKTITEDPSILMKRGLNNRTLLHTLAIKGCRSPYYSPTLTIDAINALTVAPEGAVNLQDNKGMTPFHYQVLNALPTFDERYTLKAKNHYEVHEPFLNFAFQNKYDFSLTDAEHGFTVIHLLSRNKSLEATKMLRDILKDIRFTDTKALDICCKNNGKTALSLAINAGALTMATLLLDAGASPKVAGNDTLKMLGNYKRVLSFALESKEITQECFDRRTKIVEDLEIRVNESIKPLKNKFFNIF